MAGQDSLVMASVEVCIGIDPIRANGAQIQMVPSGAVVEHGQVDLGELV